MSSQGDDKGIRSEMFIAAVKFFRLDEPTEHVKSSSEIQCSDPVNMGTVECQHMVTTPNSKERHNNVKHKYKEKRGRLSIFLLKKRKQKRDQYLARGLKDF